MCKIDQFYLNFVSLFINLDPNLGGTAFLLIIGPLFVSSLNKFSVKLL